MSIPVRALFPATMAVLLGACLLNSPGLAPADGGGENPPTDADADTDAPNDADTPDSDNGGDDADDIVPDGDLDADSDVDGDADSDADTDVGPDADADEDEETPVCTSEEIDCDGDTLLVCDSGAWAPAEVCALGCSIFHERCMELDTSNVSHGFFAHAEYDVTISSSVTANTDDCATLGASLSPDAPYTEVVPSAEAELCVIVVASLTVDVDVELRFTGHLIPVILSYGDIHISGVIDVGARGTTPGPGGGAGGPEDTDAEWSPCGGGRGHHRDSYDDSGGGGGAHAANGGNGGTRGEADPGLGGTSRGARELDPIEGGCGGGGGSSDGNDGGYGGGGGGAIQLSSRTSITIESSGVVRAPGGGGLGGNEGGAGGGAGGGILLEAPSVAVLGTIAANGGGGGSGDGNSDGHDGLDSASTASGGTDKGDWGCVGGHGGAGDDEVGQTPSCDDLDGGGGGGSVGRIRINTRFGEADIDVGATLSPTGSQGYSEGGVSMW